MFKNINLFKKKSSGSIIIYTLMISFIILIISIYKLTSQFEEYFYNHNNLKIFTIKAKNENKKEELFTELYNLLKVNILDIREEELNKFLKENEGKTIISNNTGKIKVKDDKIIIEYEINNKNFIKEEFKLKIRNKNFVIGKK